MNVHRRRSLLWHSVQAAFGPPFLLLVDASNSDIETDAVTDPLTTRYLLDEFAPTWTVRSRHAVEVSAPVERTFAAVEHADFSSSRVIGVLMGLRGFGRPNRPVGNSLVERMIENGFTLLAQNPGLEVVFGIAGQFWKPSGGRVKLSAEEFRGFSREGFARAAFHFRVEAAHAGRSRLLTETRVMTFGPSATRRFGIYWALVGPFSGWIRHEMLKCIKRDAERST